MSDIRLYAHALWCDLLDRASVGDDEDFFDLGGDSMLAIKMLVAVLAKADASIDLELFFERPTLGYLLSLIP